MNGVTTGYFYFSPSEASRQAFGFVAPAFQEQNAKVVKLIQHRTAALLPRSDGRDELMGRSSRCGTSL